MAIAYDTVTNAGSWNGSESSVTWSHTCSGSDRVLVVNVNSWTNSCTGVTYNGVSMTAVGNVTYNTWNLYAFILINPASGANNIVATMNTATYTRCMAASFSGADQTTQPDTYSASTSDTPITATVTATANNWLVAGAINPNSGTHTAGTNTTKVGLDYEQIATYISSVARTSGSQSLEWSNSVNANGSGYVLMAIKEKASAGGGTVTPTPTLAFLGCG